MSDEQINIQVTDSGTQSVIDVLQQLGLSGEAAAERVASGFRRTGDGAAQATQAVNLLSRAEASGVTDTDALESAMSRLTRSELSAVTAANGLKTSFNGIGAAADGSVASLAKAEAGSKSFGTSIGGLGSAVKGLIAAFAFKAFEDASDTYTKMSNQLKLVTTSTTDFSNVYGELMKTADRTGTSISSNVDLYSKMAAAMKGTTVTSQEMIDATNSIADALKIGGASTDQVTRTMKELAETYAKGEFNGKQFLSILSNTPQVVRTLASGLGVTVQQLEAMIKSTEGAAKSTGDMDEALQKASISTQQATLNSTKLGEEAAKAHDKLIASFSDDKATFKQRQALQDNYSNSLAASNIANQQRSLASDKQIDASHKSTGTTATLTAEQIVKGFAAARKASDELAAQMDGTMASAITILNNHWVDYVGKLNEATGANKIIREGIIAIAQNLNTIIPIVGAFVAVWALSTIVASVRELITALKDLRTAVIALNIVSYLNPWTIAFAVIGVAIAALITLTGSWGNVWTTIATAASNAWNVITTGAAGATQVLTAVYNFLSSNLATAWSQFANGASIAINAVVTALGTIITTITSIIKAVGNLIETVGSSLVQAWNSAVQSITQAISNVIQFIGSFIKAIGSAIQSVASWVQEFINGAGAILSALGKIIGLQSQVNVPSAGGGGGGAPSIPVQRDGTPGGWVVGGHGQGVDSQMVQFMASPGEQVIVRTPTQQLKNIIPPVANSNAGGYGPKAMPHNAVGTSFVLSLPPGIILPGGKLPAPAAAAAAAAATNVPPTHIGGGGLGFQRGSLSGVNVAFSQAANTSVTGYSPANENAITTQSATTETTASIPSSSSSASATASGWQALFDQYMTDELSVDQWPIKPQYYEAGTYQRTTQNVSVEQYRTLDGKRTFRDPVSPFGSSTTNKGRRQADAYNIAYAQAHGAKPWSSAQTALVRAQVTAAEIPDWGAYNASPASYTPGGRDGVAFYVGGYRDGGDYTVPGSGAVDSRLIALHASPGEAISVKRPQDKKGPPPTTNITVNFAVHAKDANSVRKSQPQQDRELQKRLTRISSRVNG